MRVDYLMAVVPGKHHGGDIISHSKTSYRKISHSVEGAISVVKFSSCSEIW